MRLEANNTFLNGGIRFFFGMMYGDGLSPLHHIIDRKTETFGAWAMRHLPALFLPKREPNYSLSSILHLFMKRLSQPYDQIMRMDEETRDEIFKAECDVIEREKQNNAK